MGATSSTLVDSPDSWISSVPVEIWEQIFRQTRREDLLRAQLACRAFYAVGKRVLWSELIWRQPARILDAPGELLRRDIALHVPRSLQLSTHLVDPHQAATHEWLRLAMTQVIGLNGFYEPLDDRISRLGFAHLAEQGATILRTDHASLALYKKILIDVTAFSQLRHLSIQNAHLPVEVYATITGLPELKTLEFVNCSLPFPATTDHPGRFATLPIDTFTLDRTLLLRGSRAPEGIAFTTLDPLIHPLLMATANQLTTLNIGWKESFFAILGQKASYPNLRRIHVSFLRDSANDDGAFALAELPRFLAICSGLLSLEIASPARNSHMGFVDLPTLTRYVGPMSLARAMSAPALRELVLTDIRSVDTSAFLDVVRTLPRSIEVLSAKVDKWDPTLVPTLSACVSRLRSLHIAYLTGGPSTQYLLHMGDRYLVRFRRLHTLRIYLAIWPGPVSNSTTSELACRWSIPCESLRVVQLCERSVWTFDGDSENWQQSLLSPLVSD